MKIPGHENVIYQAKKHWITTFSAIAVTVFLILLILIFMVLAVIYLPGFAYGDFLKGALVIIFSLILVGSWMFGFNLWLNNYYDILILTENELVKVEQSGFFDRKINEIPLIEITEINATSKSLLQVFLSFGKIEVVAGGDLPENFMFDYIEKPIDLATKLIQAHNQLVKKEKRGKELPEPGKSIAAQEVVTEVSTKFSRHPAGKEEPPLETEAKKEVIRVVQAEQPQSQKIAEETLKTQKEILKEMKEIAIK